MIVKPTPTILPAPPIPEETEAARIQAFQLYQVINNDLEVPFDDLAELAAELCHCPVALITLIGKDIQWYLARHGTEIQQVRRAESFCEHVLASPYKALVIDDLETDMRFMHHPWVLQSPGYRFYAGIPITTAEGYVIGTLCVMDYKPNTLNKLQIRMLKVFANQILTQLELSSKVNQLEKTHEKLELANKELSRFAYVVAHDIRSPLKNIDQLSMLLEEENKGILSPESNKMLGFIRKRAQDLNNLVSGILHYSLSDKKEFVKRNIHLPSLISNIVSFVNPPDDIRIVINTEIDYWETDETILHQILQNLLSNAVKYNDKSEGIIELTIRKENDKLIEIKVSDNGPGIPDELKDKVFEPFTSLKAQDRFGKKGNGIGLATVKNLTEKLGGRILLRNNPQGGSLFKLMLPV